MTARDYLELGGLIVGILVLLGGIIAVYVVVKTDIVAVKTKIVAMEKDIEEMKETHRKDIKDVKDDFNVRFESISNKNREDHQILFNKVDDLKDIIINSKTG